jgi:hypothetical protein
MKRLTVATGAVALFIAACSGTASTAPSLPASIAVPSNLASQAMAGASAAIDKLCNDKEPASLSNVAGDLEKVGTNTDTSDLEGRLGTLLTNLKQLQADPGTKPLGDSAATAITQAQSSLKDPKTRQDAAKRAAGSLRSVDVAVCK